LPNETPKGTAVAELGLAIKRVWTDNQGAAPQKREEATFVDVTLWARLAEIARITSSTTPSWAARNSC
jgi:single-strand DNA-binding protein